MKGSGLVDSKRGFYGGYFLTRPPDKISVGDVLRFHTLVWHRLAPAVDHEVIDSE